MLSVLVVADDLTGANATGAMFARLGLRTHTISRSNAAGSSSVPEDTEVLVLTTASRQLSDAAAAARVADILRGVGDLEPRLLVKRVDTTLRGPVAAELAAVLAFRRTRTKAVALAVPAYPSAGRVTIGGMHLLDGRPLVRTSAGQDPMTPVRSSRVATVLTRGTPLTSSELYLDDLTAADFDDRLARALLHADVVVADAESDGDLVRVGDAAARFRGTHPDTDVVVVDSGPFGAAYSKALQIPGSTTSLPSVLVVIGSPTTRTQDQLRTAEQALTCRIVEVEASRAADDDAKSAIAAIDAGCRIVGWSVPRPQGPLDTSAAEHLPARLAELTRTVVSARPVGGLFTCGGEVAAAVVEALDANGLAVETEVQPLVVTGRLVGGPWRGLPIITKGGLIGDDRVVLDSIFQLQSMRPLISAPASSEGQPT